MARNESDKQLNITMPAEKKSELEQFCAENGLSLNAAMNKALGLLLIDRLKTQAPDQAASIEDFEVCVNNMLSYYKQAIEHSVHARAAAELDVKEELKGMAALAESNKQLQAELLRKTDELAKVSAQATAQQTRIEELEKQLASSHASDDEISELKAQVVALTQEKADLQIKHNEEIKRLQEDNFEKILKLMTAGSGKKS